MALRCFLFSSDEGTAASIRQILFGLGVEGEFCPNAVTAVERITNQSFQIVIIDWDQQPEAGLLLSSARERKASERPITLAIVSSELSVPQAMQAGANSILRKPIVVQQARETLTTARDLLRARQSSASGATQAAAAAAAAASVAPPSSLPSTLESAKVLRAGEFLQSPTSAPGGQFVTEAPSPDDSLPEAVDPLKDLEPMAASVSGEQSAPAVEPEAPGGARGLQWYLKTRVATQAPENAPAAAATAPARGNPELLGYDQSASYAPPPVPEPVPAAPIRSIPDLPATQEQKKTAELFTYIQEGRAAEEANSPTSGVWKKAILAALFLAACAVVAAPQAPWHPRLQNLWQSGRQSIHAWLYPQPVTPVQAPVTHESFSRPGDEYKLPVAEAIPDATTDPSQIKVVPVIDPTLKKPNADAAPPDGSAIPSGSTPPTDVVPTPAPENPASSTSGTSQPVSQAPASAITPTQVSTIVPAASTPVHREPPPASATSVSTPVGSQTAQPKPISAPNQVPTSLKSQLAPATPAVGGNKPLEAALPSIEPVPVSETTELLLLAEGPAPAYPESAKGQQGTVTLQVLISRDGTVKDAKFLQGSLVFARNAIEGVRQWKFRPYIMNGHPVSVQTQLTLRFNPTQ